MSKVIVVGYDGSDSSVRAVNYAAEKAKTNQATVKIIHILEWSPYTFLTPEELEERHARRKEELSRAQSSLLDPMINKLSDSGLNVEGEVRYGNIVEVMTEYCDEVDAQEVFIGRHGGGSKFSTRLFGSVPVNLVQASKIPVIVVP